MDVLSHVVNVTLRFRVSDIRVQSRKSCMVMTQTSASSHNSVRMTDLSGTCWLACTKEKAEFDLSAECRCIRSLAGRASVPLHRVTKHPRRRCFRWRDEDISEIVGSHLRTRQISKNLACRTSRLFALNLHAAQIDGIGDFIGSPQIDRRN